jgi:hypothetical protein
VAGLHKADMYRGQRWVGGFRDLPLTRRRRCGEHFRGSALAEPLAAATATPARGTDRDDTIRLDLKRKQVDLAEINRNVVPQIDRRLVKGVYETLLHLHLLHASYHGHCDRSPDERQELTVANRTRQ